MKTLAFIFLFCFGALSAFTQNQQMYIKTSVSATGPFTDPTDIANLILWLDAKDVDGNFDGSTGDPSDATGVQNWIDKSTSGADFTQSTVADRPVMDIDGFNGFPTLDFDGTNHWMQNNTLSNSSSEYTVFIVKQGDDADGADNQTLLDFQTGRMIWQHATGASSNDGDVGLYNPTNGWQYIDGVDNNGVGVTTDAVIMRIELFAGTGTSGLYYNSIQEGSSVNYTNTAIGGNIGLGGRYDGTSSQEFDGRISEVLIYARELTASEIADVENYLNQKWAVPLSIADLELWLDGSDVDGDFLREGTSEAGLTGSVVDAWKDKSGNGRHFSSNTNGATLTNISGDIYALTSDGNDDYLADGVASDWTWWHSGDVTVVIRFELDNINTEESDVFFTTLESSTGNTGQYFGYSDATSTFEEDLVVINGNSTPTRTIYTILDASSLTANTYTDIVFYTDVDGAWSTPAYKVPFVELDGTDVTPNTRPSSVSSVTTPDSGAPSYKMYLMGRPGAGDYFEGSIAEIMIYSRQLTAAEIDALQAYLTNKY